MAQGKNWYRRKSRQGQSRWEELKDLFRYGFQSLGLIIWFVVFVLALLEIKRYYNIDLIPGYDSSIDDIYGAARGTLSEWFD